MDEENDAFPFQDEENGNGEDPLNEFGGERVSADTADGNGEVPETAERQGTVRPPIRLIKGRRARIHRSWQANSA